MRSGAMKLLGLTGGIACGKSTVSAMLCEAGVPVIDADALCHTLMEVGQPLYRAYVSHWGRGILLPDGQLDRRGIGARVFSDAQERAWMNDTAHPIIREAMLDAIQREERRGMRLCVLDVPLLYEAGWDALCDAVCVVWVRPEVQRARLIARNGWTAEEADARIAAQMPLSDKRARADVCIDNNGTVEETRRQVRALLQRLLCSRL